MNRIVGLLLTVAVCCATSVEAKDGAQSNPSGSWRWIDEMTSTEMTLQLDMKEAGKLEGLFLGMGQEVPVKDCTIKKNAITGEVTLSVQGDDLVCDLRATFDGDEMLLVSEYSGSVGTGQVTVKPERSVKAEDIVGKWKLDMTTDDGNHREPVVEFSINDNKKLTATIRGEDGDIEVTSVRIEKNEINIAAESDYDGVTVKSTFSGRPYGSKWNGSMGYDYNGVTGETPFKAKRLESDGK